MYRQGDLLFIKADSLPQQLTKKHDKIVLGSNITGHSHELTQAEYNPIIET